jgi:hypothetical protein
MVKLVSLREQQFQDRFDGPQESSAEINRDESVWYATVDRFGDGLFPGTVGGPSLPELTGPCAS